MVKIESLEGAAGLVLVRSMQKKALNWGERKLVIGTLHLGLHCSIQRQCSSVESTGCVAECLFCDAVLDPINYSSIPPSCGKAPYKFHEPHRALKKFSRIHANPVPFCRWLREVSPSLLQGPQIPSMSALAGASDLLFLWIWQGSLLSTWLRCVATTLGSVGFCGHTKGPVKANLGKQFSVLPLHVTAWLLGSFIIFKSLEASDIQ